MADKSPQKPWWKQTKFSDEERAEIREAMRDTIAFVARAQKNGESGLLAPVDVVSNDDLNRLIEWMLSRGNDREALRLLVGRISSAAPIDEVRAWLKANGRAV